TRDLAYFCDGLYQELIHHLARVETLRVVALPPADAASAGAGFQYAGQVAMLLSGAVRKAGDRLRVTVHLVDSATASYLWSESVDAAIADIFAAQELVADGVLKKLEPRLTDEGQRRGSRRPAENLAARNLYVQGRYHLNQRTDEGLQKALDFFEKAI